MEAMHRVLEGKIHRATVTHANLDYEGSITLPPDLLAASGIHAYEAVWVWNVTSGTRFETYAMQGPSDTSDISVNGAAAHLVTPGDIVIVACFMQLPQSQLAYHRPKVVFVDEHNHIVTRRSEIPGPERAVIV